jgi:hypothetical protein
MKGNQGSIEQYRDNRPSEFETTQIGAIEVSLMLFRQFDKNCVNLVTELQNHGAGSSARPRWRPRLCHAAKFGHWQSAIIDQSGASRLNVAEYVTGPT